MTNIDHIWATLKQLWLVASFIIQPTIDALVPYITSASTAMVMNMQNKWVLVFSEVEFQGPLLFHCGEKIVF